MVRSHSPGPFPGGNRYNAYGSFLKQKFGCRVYKVIVDAGFSCPNRDGSIGFGGCTYCTNDSFRPASVARQKPVTVQVAGGIEYLQKRYRAKKFIVYFQPFTNTHGPLERLIPLCEEALSCPGVVGLSMGTRPDCVEDEKIAWFEELARSYFITLEYGLESIYDSTLVRINRGHDFQCWLDAMRRTRDRGIWLGAHLILGFPWETREEMLRAADVVSDKGLNFLKLHHLHVVGVGAEHARRAHAQLLRILLGIVDQFGEGLPGRVLLHAHGKGEHRLSPEGLEVFESVVGDYLGLPELVVEIRKAYFEEVLDKACSAVDVTLQNVDELKMRIGNKVWEAKMDARRQIEEIAKDILS